MATIYQKLITGGIYDQCLILNQFEGVQYELPTETQNWTDIRIGLMLSLTTFNDNNAQIPATDTISSLTFIPENSPWIGLKTNNQYLPCHNDTAFIGIGYPASSFSITSTDLRYWPNFKINTTETIPFIMGSGEYPNDSYKYSASYGFGTAASQAQGLFPWISGTTGTTPSSLFAIRFTKISGGNAINWNFCRNGNEDNSPIPLKSTADTSIDNLRNYMSAFGNYGSTYDRYRILSKSPYTTTEGDPFTVDGTMSGAAISNPNSFFIYWPFPQTRLRIHNFAVEKYS